MTRRRVARWGKAAGVDLRTVQELLGHDSVATTEVYTKVIARKKQSAIMRLPSYPQEAGEPSSVIRRSYTTPESTGEIPQRNEPE